MNCKCCGKPIQTKRMKGYCQGCYNYFRKGGVIHIPPLYGETKQNEKGEFICHICGKAFTRLGSHLKESHNMTIDGYKSKFGLCKNTRTTSEEYHNKMHELALKNNMDKQLIKMGIKTRFNNRFLKGKPRPISQQEINMIRKRNLKLNNK